MPIDVILTSLVPWTIEDRCTSVIDTVEKSLLLDRDYIVVATSISKGYVVVEITTNRFGFW